ncbi:MAG: hypothetical protein K8F91_00820 [Candidatus Obscuribacterales bacterium]|nr:hypothetical protein [Candidatus Obscuribacterales bacterium]
MHTRNASSPLIETLAGLLETNLSAAACAERRLPDAILMCQPTYFDVLDVKNSFMTGNIDCVDKSLAIKQWQRLKSTIEDLGFPVKTVSAVPGLEDMVFSANQGLIGSDSNGSAFFIPGKMRHDSRQREVPHYTSWFESNGYAIIPLAYDTISDESVYFEGHGDAIWHHGKNLLWGGFGHRTSKNAYRLLSARLDCPIVLLELVNPTFYHLDTAFCVLDNDNVLYYPQAFSEDGQRLIRELFPWTIQAEEKEAHNFACNALALGKNVLIEKDNHITCSSLEARGFQPVEVDTCEFMKSGGSVFCLKTQIHST